MRLSVWRARAPFKESVAPKVQTAVDTAIAALGSDVDPECWVVWGDDPATRYLIFIPTPSGLVQVNVRVAVPGEGPRASGKIVRWNRVQLGELGVEIQAGHRLVTFQIETQVLNGADAAADAIAAFAQALFAAVDGRAAPSSGPAKKAPTGKRGVGGVARAGAGTRSNAKAAAPATRVPRLAAPKRSAQ